MANDDAVARLSWLLRRHAALLLLGVVVFALLGTLLQPRASAPSYRSEALIVARDLVALKVEQLPRMASTVFGGGNVARNAVEDGELTIDPSDLIPDYASLEPIEGTLLLRVVGITTDADTAARIANAAADALTVELNRAGPTIARFVVQEAAVAPVAPEDESRQNFTVLGALAGLFIGLGLLTFVVTVRRPILSLADLRERVRDPLLPGPAVPPPGRSLDLLRTPGLAAVVKQFYASGTERCAFVSCRGGGRWRSQTALAVALLLARGGPVTLVTSAERGARRLYRKAFFTHDTGLIKNLALVGSTDEARPGIPLVLDGLSAGAFDVPQLLPPDMRILLVVPQGSSASSVETALRQFLPGEVTAVLFVPRAPGWRPPARRPRTTEPAPTTRDADRQKQRAFPMTRMPERRPG